MQQTFEQRAMLVPVRALPLGRQAVQRIADFRPQPLIDNRRLLAAIHRTLLPDRAAIELTAEQTP
jgi:hypothetical protein